MWSFAPLPPGSSFIPKKLQGMSHASRLQAFYSGPSSRPYRQGSKPELRPFVLNAASPGSTFDEARAPLIDFARYCPRRPRTSRMLSRTRWNASRTRQAKHRAGKTGRRLPTRPFSAPAETSGNWLNPSRRREILPLTRIQFKPRHHSAVLHLELRASRPPQAGYPRRNRGRGKS